MFIFQKLQLTRIVKPQKQNEIREKFSIEMNFRTLYTFNKILTDFQIPSYSPIGTSLQRFLL